jgi:hypothetical protein
MTALFRKLGQSAIIYKIFCVLLNKDVSIYHFLLLFVVSVSWNNRMVSGRARRLLMTIFRLTFNISFPSKLLELKITNEW